MPVTQAPIKTPFNTTFMSTLPISKLSPQALLLLNKWEELSYPTDRKALKRYLIRYWDSYPSNHQSTLGYLRWMNEDLKLMENKYTACPPLMAWRDALQERMLEPASCMEDVEAKLTYAQEAERRMDWVWFDGEECRDFMANILEDIRRLKRKAKTSRAA